MKKKKNGKQTDKHKNELLSEKVKNEVAKSDAVSDKDECKNEKEPLKKTVGISLAQTDDNFESPYSEIHEKAEGIPEDLAQDICEAISDAREREEKRNKKSKRHPGAVTFREIILALSFGIVLYWALNHARGIFSFISSVADILSPIIVGLCIAFVLNLVLIPLESLWDLSVGKIPGKSFSKHLEKLKRPLCLVLSTVVAVGVICGILFIVIPELGVTFRMFADMTPNLIKKAEVWLDGLTDFLAQRGLTLPDLLPSPDKAIKFVTDLFTQKGQQVLDATVDVTTTVFSALFDVVLSFVFAFYVLAQKEKLSKKIKSILYALTEREKADTVIKIAALSNSTFTKFVTGQFTEAVIIGVLCWLGMLIFGMPYAGVVSVVIGATALIPIFGAFIGAAIGVILILAVDFMQAVWFLVFIIVLQQLETNLIYPRVVGKSIGLPGILVLASVTVGGAVFGFTGILLGVPVCSVIYCVFNEFVEQRNESPKRDDGKSL